MFKKLLCFSAALALCLTSFIVPSFADTNLVYVPYSSNLNTLDTNTWLYYGQYSNNSEWYLATNLSESVFVFYVPTNGYNAVVIACDSSLNPTVTAKSGGSTSPGTPNQLSSTYNLKYNYGTSSSGPKNPNPDIPVFNTLDEGLSAIRNFLDNPPVSSSILEVPFINSDPQNIDPSDALYLGTSNNDIYVYQRANKPICASILNSNFALSSLTSNAKFVIVRFNNGQYVSYEEGICNVSYNSPDTFYSNNMRAVPVTYNTSIASYSDSSTWQTDVYDFLQTTHSNALLNKPLTLNPGNVIWIEADSDTTYSIKAEFDVLSDLFGNTWNPHTMQFGRNNIIQQGQYPLQGSNDLVPTTNNTDDTNMVGQSKIGYTTITHGSSTYIYIYNPYYRRYAPGLTYVTNLHNPILTITPSKPVYNAVYLPLDNQLNLTTGIVGSTDSDNSQSVSVDPQTGDYIYSGVINGEDTSSTTPPPSGGQNLQNVAQGNTLGITDYLNKITETITEFTNNILELVKAPISHIGQLIEAGSGFMSALRGMYAWLPIDIQGLVISALTVVIAIGVFKVFL